MSRNYDQDSGQVFKEWILPRSLLHAHPPDGDDWARQRRYPLVGARGRRGPRSLVQMAISVIADNIGYMSSELLEPMPTALLTSIWAFLEARGINLQAWKIFSKVKLDQCAEDETTLGLYRFRQHICKPSASLPAYTSPLTSLSVEFIAHLVISGGCEFTVPELLCLADMRNLGVLEFMQPADEVRLPFPEVSDRLVRGWTEKNDPFPLLRVLRIWAGESTTRDSLRWVSQFPSLALYDVKGLRADWHEPGAQAQAHGWTFEIPKNAREEDTLLHHLMLFAQVDEWITAPVAALSRNIEKDLTSLCSDSRCIIKFVAEGEAPPLLEYLTDPAKMHIKPSWDPDASSREAGACHSVPFEAWAFWLWSFMGQLSSDRDLGGQGVKPSEQAVVGPFVLPSKPMACLYLGHSGRGGISSRPAYLSRGLFSVIKLTFTRPWLVHGDRPDQDVTTGRVASSDGGTAVRDGDLRRSSSEVRKKRQKLDDMLADMSK